MKGFKNNLAVVFKYGDHGPLIYFSETLTVCALDGVTEKLCKDGIELKMYQQKSFNRCGLKHMMNTKPHGPEHHYTIGRKKRI